MTNLILLVEDDLADEALAVRALAKINLANEVKVARDGEAAIDYLHGSGSGRARPLPSVVLLDLRLPRIDGIEVLKRIRAHPRTQLLPVIVLTNSTDDQSRLASYRAGCTGFAAKPFEPEAFVSALRQLGVFLDPPPPLAAGINNGDGREWRVLLLEDNPHDAALVERELKTVPARLAVRRARDRTSFVQAIDDFRPDVVLADYAMPQFDGLSALRLVRERSRDLPFIVVSGFIGEAQVIEGIKAGATDYVSKERLQGLAHAVARALAEIELRAQNRRLEAMLFQAQKMEAVGQLSGGIAHDFNNLLAVVLGNLEMLGDRVAQDERSKKCISAATRAATRGADLVRRLLVFSQKRARHEQTVDINLLVRGIEPIIRRAVGENVELRIDVPAAPSFALVDEAQFESAILNLAINARDAMPGGGVLTVGVSQTVIGEAQARPGLHPGRYVSVAVSDTGAGMTPEVLQHAFEPFFTTKAIGKGSGLGLSMVYGFVKEAGGDVTIASELGRGTTLTLDLPWSAAEPPALPRSSAQSAATAFAGTRVVVVDDEVDVRGVAAMLLEQLGCTVLEASSAADALALLERERGADVLFSDLVMPGGMNGIELAVKAREQWPKLGLVLASGYADLDAVQGASAPPGTIFVNKPYRRADLAVKLARAFEK